MKDKRTSILASDAYRQHPSDELQNLFSMQELPSQGQELARAKVVVIGLDANYSSRLLEYPIFFERVLAYHTDGVAFWREHGVHHPFLLPEYPLNKRGGGVPYHRRFQAMGLNEDYADSISFVELLNVPTSGRTQWPVFWELFDSAYAARLESVLANGESRMVILSTSVLQVMNTVARRFGLFSWLPRTSGYGPIAEVGKTHFVKFKHFSSAISNAELFKMGSEIKSFCKRR